MTDNAKKQDEIENHCMERLKKNISSDNSYGFSVDEFLLFEDIFETIGKNKNSNKFPDFILQEGFVEHFVVTSSQENKKGASHKIAEVNYLKENKKIVEQLSPDRETYSNKMNYEGHSYANLQNSFKKNWNKHIQSLQKYNGEQKIGIFLIEYLDHMALAMCEMSLEDKPKITSGDYDIRQEKTHDYRLSRDKKMLDWISTFDDKIDFVVFMTQEHVEIIKLSGISDLQTLLPYEYAVAPNTTFRTDRWLKM
ncbi:hypothetical protein AB6888_17270 [Carnobacterium maltaromaticum]|uniref:hypothetical protein n=1 Tax=Carnobacterium maltaromaticum TaxID=2751 RepID=UPI0039BE84A9